MIRLPQRGLSTLVVVIGLFFVAALAAAYANRHLLVEHRIARLAQDDLRAQVAAEHGLEHALALLNGDAMGDRCEALPHGGLAAPERWLTVDADGRIHPSASNADRTALLCDRSGLGEWDCRCAGASPPTPRAVGAETGASVRVSFASVDAHPGHVRVQAQGCAQASVACLTQPDWRSAEASMAIGSDRRLQLALLPALRQVPTSALLAGGQVDLGDGMAVVNTDASTHGIALHTASGVTGSRLGLVGPNGARAEDRLHTHDAALQALGGDGLMRRLTGMHPTEWTRHPALRTVHCNPTCDADAVTARLERGARWVQVVGALRIDREVQWGSPERPVLVIVNGNLSWTAAGRFVGALLVQGSAQLPQTGSQARLDGALVVTEAVQGGAATQLVHQSAVLQRLQATVGSFVRVPGGRWSRA